MGKKKHKKYLEQRRLAVNAKIAERPSLSANGFSKPTPIKSDSGELKTLVSKNVIKYKYWYLGISALLIIPGLISLGLFGLKTSIDFTGGSVLKFSRTEGTWDEKEVRQVFDSQKVEVGQVLVDAGGKSVTIRAKSIDSTKNEEIKTALGVIAKAQTEPESDQQEHPQTESESGQPEAPLAEASKITQTSFETVGSSIGAETVKKSLLALGIACLGIVLYIAYAFRNIPKPYSGFRFGVSAILAMLHDAVIVTGIFSILGHFEGVEVDPMFITALLTIIGFSVHDTIVVFDRVRENLPKFKGKSFEWIANFSILETLRRSIATSATVAITLTALLIFGGATIKYFVLALLIGVISGTYSSIFNATPILVIWEDFLSHRQKKQ